MGTVRSTFIIDDKGNILKEFRNVKAKGHAQKNFGRIKDFVDDRGRILQDLFCIFERSV